MADLDVSDLKDLARDARKAGNGIAVELSKNLALGGEVVATKARQNANAFLGKDRTTRIADSVKVRRRGIRVKVQAGGDSAPEAAPIENHGQAGTFRHPVHGNYDNWVDQPAHPFLTSAAEDSADEVEQFVLRAVDVTVARLVTG